MLFVILISVLLVYLVVNRWRQKSIIKKNKLSEVEFPYYPLFGHSLTFYGNEEAKLKALADLSQYVIKKGKFVSIWMGPKLFHGVCDPVTAQYVLKNHLEKGSIMQILREIHGSGLLSSPVPIWRYRRRVVSKFFAISNQILHMKTVQEQVRILVEKLDALAGNGLTKLRPHLLRQSFDIIGKMVVNHQFATQFHPDSELIKAFENGLTLMGNRLMSPWLYNDAMYKLTTHYKKFCDAKNIFCDLFVKILHAKQHSNRESCQTQLQEKEESPKSLLHILSESKTNQGKYLLPNEILDESLTVSTAGPDTVTATIGFVILLIADYQDVQQKLYEEIMQVVDITEDVRTNQISGLVYLDCVIKETMRLFPPVPLILRNADVDIHLLSGETLPKDSTVGILIYGVHRNTAYWGDDADEFNPERFMKPLKHPAQFMPFSDGTRDCIAKNMALRIIKTTLVALLKKFRFLPANEVTDYTSYFGLTLQHTNGFPVIVERRK